MKIGIFGGAFNPVHNGHLHLVECYLEALKLDKVILIPTAVPPHKTAENLADKNHRINMLKLAGLANNKIEISDIEFNRKGKSYTYDTLCRLKKIYPNDELFLIVGSDQFLHFQNWYRADDILSMVTLVTAAREENELSRLQSYKNENDNMKNSVISNFSVVKVASSQIRKNIADGLDISTLVPPDVEKYIRDNKLYV
ncbi:MAG: nicotinate (nicotinamide) nucleotide adenylyltransferase [Eubacterium sp.]